jgi:hypothetical protein
MKADCWLSPEGKFYFGLCHQDVAENIVKEVYGLTEDTIQNEEQFQAIVNPQRFLEKLGWMKYMNRCANGWFLDPRATATQAQINAVFIEYGDDISKWGDSY